MGIKTEPKQRVAVFDFDETLTIRDMYVVFLSSWLPLWKRPISIIFWPILPVYALGMVSNTTVKNILGTFSFLGDAEEKVQAFAQRFIAEVLPAYLRPEGVERITWHKQRHDRLVLISSNLGIFLRPWAKKMGFDAIFASEMAVKNGKLTGKLQGTNHNAQKKVDALKTFLSEAMGVQRSDIYIVAYGDSKGDEALLDYADEAYMKPFRDKDLNQCRWDRRGNHDAVRGKADARRL